MLRWAGDGKGWGALPLPLLDMTYDLQVVHFGNSHVHTCLS